MSPFHRLIRKIPLVPGRRADRGLRLMGLGALCLAAGLVRVLFGLRHGAPPHRGDPVEMGLAMLAMAMLWIGNVMVIAGDNLLRPPPRPPRPL